MRDDFLRDSCRLLPRPARGLLWDDSSHLTKPGLQSFHGLWRIWFELGATQQYYPLLHSAFWLEHRMWGDAVAGYHLTNVALHALSACLVVMIMKRLSLPGAWLAGFVFALHPVNVESVAWISEQKSTLSGVFYLASLLTYLHFYLQPDQDRRKSTYLLATGLFVLALLSKTVTATLPAVLLVIFGGGVAGSNGSAMYSRFFLGSRWAYLPGFLPLGWRGRSSAPVARISC